MKMEVASLVEAELKKTVKFEDQDNDEEKYIMSMVQAAVTKTLTQKNDQHRTNLKSPSNLFSNMQRTMGVVDYTQ